MNRESAARWFVNRFIHKPAPRRFTLYFAEIVERPKEMAASWYNLKLRNTPFHLAFEPDGDTIYIRPLHQDAQWAKGVIIDTPEGYEFHSSASR